MWANLPNIAFQIFSMSNQNWMYIFSKISKDWESVISSQSFSIDGLISIIDERIVEK